MITVRSDIGGGPKHVYDLSRSISNNVKLSIASPVDEPFFKKFVSTCGKHIKIPHRRFSISIFLKLLKYCREESVDIVHSHGRGAGIYSRLLALFGIKAVHTFHGAHIEKNLIGSIKNKLDQFLSPLSSAYICVSNDEKRQVLSAGWAIDQQTTVIHNGVDQKQLNHDYSELTQKEALLELGLQHTSKKVWGTLARLNYQKGIDDLIKEVVENRSNYEDYLFLVAGNGEEKENYSNLIKNHGVTNIVLVGEVSNPATFLRALDGYFSFARWEGFPISVIEALAVGLPCVIRDVIGHQDLTKVCKLFNKNFFETLEATSSSNDVEFSYTLDAMKDKTLDVYQHLLGTLK